MKGFIGCTDDQHRRTTRVPARMTGSVHCKLEETDLASPRISAGKRSSFGPEGHHPASGGVPAS